MVVLLAGAVLVLMGLFSGVVLVAAPLGLAAWSPGVSLWVLFPLFTLVGYMLSAAGSRLPPPLRQAPNRLSAPSGNS